MLIAKKSHHKQKDPLSVPAKRGRPRKTAATSHIATPPGSTRALEGLRAVPVDCPRETQLHAVLRRWSGADGIPAASFTVTPITVALSECQQQPVPTHLLASAIIPLMAPTNPLYISMTAEEWFSHACASPIMHATLARLGCMTSLVSLSVYDDDRDKEVPYLTYYRGLGEAAVPVSDTAPRVSPVPEPGAMVSEIAACLLELAEQTHARRIQQAADLSMLLDCLASRENEPLAIPIPSLEVC
jgi:hypothetical protein